MSLSPPYSLLPAARDALDRLSDIGVDLRRAYGASGPDHLPTVPETVADRMTELIDETTS